MGFLKKLVTIIPVLAVGLYFLRSYLQGGVCMSDAKLTGKVVIITGANTGIGKMNALDHVQRGARVIMACRSMERGEAAAADILNITGVPKSQLEVMKLDLSSLASIRKFVEEFKKKETRLDILTNNAGVMWLPQSKTEDGFETTMGVNHLGHFLLTNLLLDMLKKSAPSRIINVASIGHVFSDLDLEDLMLEKSYSSFKSYSNSKLANILFTRELAKRLEGTRVTTYAIHPGTVSTDLLRHYQWLMTLKPILDPIFYFVLKDGMAGAQTQICCAVDPALADVSGKYYSDCAEEELRDFAQDDVTAAKLWTMSAALVGLKDHETA